MHIPTHIMSGWCLASLVPRIGPRGRLFCMIAGTIPDLDGIGIVGDFLLGHDEPTWYWAMHHKVGHGVFAAVVVCGLLTLFTRHYRGRALLAYLAAFHLHLLLDYFGSGPHWDVYYVWPISNVGFVSPHAWPLSSWQNILVALQLLCWTIYIAWRYQRTPLEIIAPSLDQRWVRRLSSGAQKPML